MKALLTLPLVLSVSKDERGRSWFDGLTRSGSWPGGQPVLLSPHSGIR
jgi:hypothetical protein